MAVTQRLAAMLPLSQTKYSKLSKRFEDKYNLSGKLLNWGAKVVAKLPKQFFLKMSLFVSWYLYYNGFIIPWAKMFNG